MKTPKEILLEIVPKDCYWEEMDNLTNTPVRYVIEAMERYAEQKLNIAGVMQAEASAGAEGAAVGQRSVDTGVSEGCCDHVEWVVRLGVLQCANCGKPH